MLIHDLGDLSYMVERHTNNEDLLRRADELIEHRRAALKARATPARRRRA
jgi:hypothetical protein